MRKFGVTLVRGVVKVVGRLPLKVHYFFGDFIAWVLEIVVRYRRDVVMINLARSFPQMKYGQLKAVADEFYKHLGEIFAEAIWFGASDYKRLYDSGIVTVTNPEVFNNMFESSPNTTVLFSHCGNWELLGGVLGYRTSTGEKLAFQEQQIRVVYKELHSKFSDDFFRLNRVAPLEHVGPECEIESSRILRVALKGKDSKAVYIYIADQFPYVVTHYSAGEFLHQQTLAMLGSVGVAHKLGHGVVYLKMKRVKRGKYEMTFVPICDDASKQSPEDIMRKYFDILEEEICETPHNWLWSHKRWK
jgi:KDO2-lipid IV(A) lauroyltransferase